MSLRSSFCSLVSFICSSYLTKNSYSFTSHLLQWRWLINGEHAHLAVMVAASRSSSLGSRATSTPSPPPPPVYIRQHTTRINRIKVLLFYGSVCYVCYGSVSRLWASTSHPIHKQTFVHIYIYIIALYMYIPSYWLLAQPIRTDRRQGDREGEREREIIQQNQW